MSNAIRHDARFVSTGSKPAIVPLGYNLMLQIRELRFHIASLLAFGVTVLGGVIVIARRKHVPIAILTRDPPASLNYHSYTGALSYLGIIIWAGCAAICLFTGWAMRNRSRDHARLFLSAGLFSSLLTIDDLYMIHDNLPFQIGTPSWLDAPFYAGLLAAFLFYNRQEIIRTRYVLLAIALTCLASSLATDVISDWVLPAGVYALENLLEDGLKFLGILFWTAYFVDASSAAIASYLQRSSSAGDVTQANS